MGPNTRTSSRYWRIKETDVVGLCDGVFDLLHYGHVLHLQNCKKLCDVLIVYVANDIFARRKGKDRPIVGERARLAMVYSLRCVDHALINDGSVESVNDFQPDVYFRNEDYKLDPGLDRSILLMRMPVYGSTTALIKKIRGEE